MTDAAVAGQPKANQTSANVCSDTCATLGLGGVTAAVQGVWAKVSRTAFLGNMTDDHGVENEDDVKKKDLDLLKQKGHWDQFHHENTRRPSYHEPRSPVGDSTVEVGVAYSQEEEMAGRLHAELEKMKREGSTAQLTASAA